MYLSSPTSLSEGRIEGSGRRPAGAWGDLVGMRSDSGVLVTVAPMVPLGVSLVADSHIGGNVANGRARGDRSGQPAVDGGANYVPARR
ncbi:hypothetical protein Ga0074812_114114 [Parafrankia irregularis]|uniref:Uncharacterized protein n=1 Tax=Parafrankia irregularis TaxID=795642 RepID=A0A0S4QTN2_9ACTN|nr:hypothetical protein Ga0074812_114114 [Parafrankia irregularis]